MNEFNISEIEKRIINFLEENKELKLKEFFVSDLSWIEVDPDIKETMAAHGYAKNKVQAIVDFFTKRFGKRLLNILPKDIKEFIVNHSDE
jgi:hypothetical protein